MKAEPAAAHDALLLSQGDWRARPLTEELRDLMLQQPLPGAVDAIDAVGAAQSSRSRPVLSVGAGAPHLPQ